MKFFCFFLWQSQAIWCTNSSKSSSSKLLLNILIGFDSTVPICTKGRWFLLWGLSSQQLELFTTRETELHWVYLCSLYQLCVFRLKFTASSASNQLNPYCLQGQKHKCLTPPALCLLFLVCPDSLAISRKCKQHQGLGDSGQAWGQSCHDRAIR